MMSMLQGFAGTKDLSFFKVADWVDVEKKPGYTQQKLALNDWWRPYITLAFVIYSPNLVWLLIALTVWYIFPYDYSAAATGFSFDWMAKRAAVAISVTFLYTGFWHVVLYFNNWGTRPFKANRKYKWSKLLHNMTYSLLGCLQWSLWDCIFIRCYASGRLPYMTDEEVYGSARGVLIFIAWFFFVPLYRDLHFYFAHRFLHIKTLYKYAHSIHHRNTDVEPFSGLSMHPVEHLYYFSCVGPALYCYAPPFAFLWNGIHLLLSPAAAHSGYEDHFQADQFHYLHHRYFECNYGTSAIPFDHWFGTFCNKLKTQKGETNAENVADIADAKANLFSATATSADYVLYSLAIMGIFVLFAVYVTVDEQSMRSIRNYICSALHLKLETVQRLMTIFPYLLSLIVAIGPVLISAFLIYVYSNSIERQKLRKLLLYPFHEECLFGPLGLHLCMGVLICVIPVYHTAMTLLLPPGQSVGCKLWGGC